MFQGTIPQPLRSIVHEHAAGWPTGDVYVGCSGNLTIERTLAEVGRGLHSNDVNPYSCALGWYFSGQPLDYHLRDESRDELGWLEPYLDGGVGTLATLMLGTTWLGFVGRDTPYHQRMVAAYRDQWPRLHATTVEKLSAVTVRLRSFFPGDVRDYLDAVPADAPVVMFPPFWAKGYAAMFKGLETHFLWPEPSFTELDEAGKGQIIERVVDRPYWLLGLHYLDETLEPHRVGYVKPTTKAVPIWVYARPGHTRRVGPRQATAPILMPKIAPDDELTGPLRLHMITGGQFNGLRSQFLDNRIEPASPVVCVAVSSGGKIRYRRLSKLIVMAAMSTEAQQILERLRSHRTIRWATTAFSDNPISGKYGRGIPGVRLLTRKPCTVSDHTWQLSYVGPLGAWSLDQALAMWQAKHGKVLK